jgi:hypothetical protein
MNAFPMVIAGLNPFDGAPCPWWPRRSPRSRERRLPFAQTSGRVEPKLNRQVMGTIGSKVLHLFRRPWRTCEVSANPPVLVREYHLFYLCALPRRACSRFTEWFVPSGSCCFACSSRSLNRQRPDKPADGGWGISDYRRGDRSLALTHWLASGFSSKPRASFGSSWQGVMATPPIILHRQRPWAANRPRSHTSGQRTGPSLVASVGSKDYANRGISIFVASGCFVADDTPL